MNITKHISLDKDCVDKMKPFVEKHSSNFSAAVREIIERAGKSGIPANASALDTALLKWMLNEMDGILIPDTVLNEIIDPGLVNSLAGLEEYLNRRFVELEWDINITIKFDRTPFPSDVLVEIKGIQQKTRIAALIISQYLVKNSPDHSPLEIRSVINSNDCMKIELIRSNKKEAHKSLLYFFGGMDEAISTVKSRPDFWKAIIKRHLVSDYNMVTVHRNYFEDILASNIPLGEISIETLAKRPIQDIPLKDMLLLIKEVYETSRVVERVEIDKDTIILFHNYRNKVAIEKLKKILILLLEANGHVFDVRSTANMIVLTHRPEVGIKINEIVSNLKTSNSRVDHELLMFMTYLKGLKDIPEIPLSLTALGRRIGTSIMQEYERENSIKKWDLENFQKALETIDSKLHRESEWKLDGKNLLYTIKKCNIVSEDNSFDTYICHTARETFKGAMSYAFGNKAELTIKKLLTRGDNFCEVVIRMP